MPSQDKLLLDMWREVARHFELAHSAPALFDILRAHLPVQALRIDHVSADRGQVETLVSTRKGTTAPVTLAAPDAHRLAEWCRGGEPHPTFGGQDIPLALTPLAPPTAGVATVFGPLRSEQSHLGVAIFTLRRALEAVEWPLLGGSLVALAAAMENQMRLIELGRLREAAEADRHSLLTRLGREQLADTIVGTDGGLGMVMQRAHLVAPTDTSVLILGETGSGKEVIARAIHDRSGRPKGPFIRINCGAIPPELIDSELFGHERGAFTGAVASRRGWFERADGGTLFLDEVGELPAAAQVRLLRVLQEGVFQRVGGEGDIHVDVRIVAATHRGLEVQVREGRFRQDLWYRIAVFPIRIPALRERTEDIPALADHLARRAARRLGLPLSLPDNDDLALLRQYAWPGNVREMAAVLERAAILGNGKRLEVRTALGAFDMDRTATPDSPAAANRGLDTLDRAVAGHIKRALARTHGRIEGPHGAARLLDVNPNTLRSRLRKLGIDAMRFRNSG